jgi:hypothetical protein
MGEVATMSTGQRAGDDVVPGMAAAGYLAGTGRQDGPATLSLGVAVGDFAHGRLVGALMDEKTAVVVGRREPARPWPRRRHRPTRDIADREERCDDHHRKDDHVCTRPLPTR